MKALVYKNLSDAFDVVELSSGTAVYKTMDMDWEHTVIIVNGKTVSPDYIIKESDIITIRSVPAGVTGLLVAAIVIGVAALAIGIYGGIKAYEARVAAERAQEEIDKMKNRSKDSVVNLPYIRGAQNTIATGKTQPYIIGEHLFVPYILNSGGKYRGYSQLGGHNGKDQYYIVVLEGGFNKQILRKLFCDDVVLKTWTSDTPQEGVYSFDQGIFYDSGSLIEIAQDGAPFDTPEFNKKIVQQAVNDNLKKRDDAAYEPLIYTLEKYAMAADICILFNGLTAYDDDGDKVSRKVTVVPYYSLDSGKTWTKFYFNQNGSLGNDFSYNTLNQLRFNAHVDFNFGDVRPLKHPVMVKVECFTNKYSGSAYDQCYIQWVQSTIYNPDLSKMYFVPEKIIGETEAKLSTTIGLKIKSTTNNQDKLKKINVVTCGAARVWDGISWSEDKRPTRNAAAWLLEVLTSPTHTPSQCDDSEIDLESFGELYEFCEREKLTCDMVLSDGDTKENVLSKICQTCYATLYQDIYGKVSVVADNKKENAIAVFNEQNLISFSYEKDLARRTDGVKIKYISREAGYAEDTCLVMRKGAVRTSDSVLRDMTVTGITEYAQVAKYARYTMACDELRPKTATARVGKEGIFFTPLAKVLVQHPSLKIGLGSAQIKTVITDGEHITALHLYEPVTLDKTHDFTVIVQCVGNTYCTPLALAIKRHKGRTKEVRLKEPLPLTSPAIPHVGDILSYGYKTETVTSPMLITGIQPDEDGYALTLVDYNEAIYETGDIPEYTPNISQSGEASAGTIPPQAVSPDDVATMIDKMTNGAVKTKKPDKPRGVWASAKRDYVHMGCDPFGVGEENNIQLIHWEVQQLPGGQWLSAGETVERRSTFPIEKSPLYYEAHDIAVWRVRCRAVNVYGVVGDWSNEHPVGTESYGTWKPSPPEIISRVTGRNVTLFLSQPPRADGREVYGSVRYQVRIKRGTLADPITGEAVAEDDTFYKPATDKNFLESEANYKDGDGFVISGDVYMQTLPLYGQNKTGAGGEPLPSPTDTPYTFSVKAVNESPYESEERTANVIALATSARDLVNNAITSNKLAPGAVTADKIHSHTITAEQLYAGDLAAGGASFGRISAGGTGLRADKSNFWDLENQEFRIGNDIELENSGDDNAEYLHYKKDTGIFFKIKNFILSSVSSVILGIFRVKDKGADDGAVFMTVNPTGQVDAVTGTTAKTARIAGLLQARELDTQHIKGNPTADNLTVTNALAARTLSVQEEATLNRLTTTGEAKLHRLTVTNNGWTATLQPCENGIELSIYSEENGMTRKQLQTAIRGGVMSLFVLGSISCANVYKNNAGENWQTMVAVGGYNRYLYSVAYGDNKWVAVGNGGEIFTSSDGKTWAKQNSPTKKDLAYVAYGDNKWVVVGEGEIFTSSDGKTWAKHNTPTDEWMNTVAYGNNRWIAKINGELIYTSSDGYTWIPEDLQIFKNTYRVAYEGNRWVIGGIGEIYTSYNGVDWVIQKLPTRKWIYSVAYGDNKWVAVGSSEIFTSSDGNTWEKQNSPTANWMKSVAYGDNKWVVVGNGGEIFTSSNGKTWAKQNSPTKKDLASVVYGDNRWVAVGEDDVIITSAADTVTWVKQ